MEENTNLNAEPENKTINYKKKRTIFIACGFVAILLITIFLLFFKDDLFKKEVEKNNNVKEENKVNAAVVENLLENALPYLLTDRINSKLYVDSLVKFDDLDQRGVLSIIIGEDDESLRLSDIDMPSEEELFSTLGDEAAGTILSAESVVPVSKVKTIIKEKYNYDNYDMNSYSEIENKTNYSKFEYTSGTAYVYNNNIFLYPAIGSYSKDKKTVSYTYEVVGNDLYVYEKMFIVKYDFPAGETTCYTDQSDVQETATTEYEEKDYFNFEDYEKEIINLCKPYAETYKHVFKLNDSGDYYWYSTEPYKA